jgi:hypothetical protein
MRNPFGGGGIGSASRAYPLEGVKKAEAETAQGYLEANAPRMRKQSRMHRTANGADAIATLRPRP